MSRITLFSGLLLMSSFVAAQLHGWDSNVYLPGQGRDDAICFTLDEIIFIGTGNHGGFAESNTFYAYNTRSGLWEDVAPFPGTPRQYAIAEEIGFKAYMIGGIDENNNPLEDVWEYDLITDTWSQKANFPGGARWKATSFMINDQIYYGTGRNANVCFNDLWRYSPKTDSWKQLKDVPVLPRNEAVGFAIYNCGYVGLGMDCTNVMKTDIWKFDPAKGDWSYETDFPAGPRWYAISEVLNGWAFVGTGEDETGTMHNDFWKYDPATKHWEQAENLPNPARRGTAACTIPFKGIYIVGGLSYTFQRLTDISRYTNRDLNPPELQVFYQADEQEIYVHGLPYFTHISMVDLSGRVHFQSNERVDHVLIDVTNYASGVYIIWAGGQSTKVLLY